MPAESTKTAQLQLLKDHLQITPKTCRMLHDSGYTTPQSLRTGTPNQIYTAFAALSYMDKSAKPYIRPLRRMVLLGATDDVDEAKAIAKERPTWTMKELTNQGAWTDDFDDLTGEQIRERMLAAWNNEN